jgi:thiamine biosynthesis lipoprotein
MAGRQGNSNIPAKHQSGDVRRTPKSVFAMPQSVVATWLRCLVLLFGALSVAPAADEPALTRYTFTEPHMGTTFRIVLYAPNEATAKKAATAAFARIAELDAIMSDYKPTSELLLLCKKAGGEPVAVSKDLYTILERSLEVAQKSDGAFDITIGPVVRLWRRVRRTRELPSAEELKKALALVNYRNIKLDSTRQTVQLLLAGMLLDLGGIAKGYAAEAALAILRQFGIRRALVAAGGDVAVGDAPPDARGWKVSVAPADDPNGEPSHHLRLVNAAVSTAGDAYQFVEIAGKRYSHIVDPKTGLGLTDRRSVTVVARDGTTADAWDTAACIMGVERGMKVIESIDGAAALFVSASEKGLTTVKSKRFASYEWTGKGRERETN